MSRALTAVAFIGLALPLVACGDDGGTSTTAESTTTTQAEEPAGAPAEDDVYVGTVGGLPGKPGVRVASFETGAPIGASGLKVDDVITAVDGEPVADIDELAAALSALSEEFDPGDVVELTVTRGGEEKTLEVTLAANVYLGVELKDAPQGGGAAVNSLVKGRPGIEAGIEKGDVIVAIDGEPVGDVADLLDLMNNYVAGDEIEVEVERGSASTTLTAKLEKRGFGELKARPGQAPEHDPG